MPKKKTPDQGEILETGMEMEQQPAGGETPPEGMDGDQSGIPDGESVEPGAGSLPAGTDEDGKQEDAGLGGLEDEPDPALDPSLVIPTLPQEAAPPVPGDGDGGFDGLEDGADPALDPSLVIPTLPQEKAPSEPEAPAKPAAPKAGKRSAKTAPAVPAAKTPKPAAAKRATPASARTQQKKAPEPPKRVVSIDDEANIQTEDEKEAYLWMELRNSLRSKRILTGILGGVERSANGLCTAVVYYKDQRIVIPASEMFINIGDDAKRDQKALYNRYAQILTRSLGAEMDFVVSGIDKRSGSVVASRKEAMIRKQLNFYLPTLRNKKPLIVEGQVVEARVISVGDKNMRVEAFGVETTILARDVAWEWVDDCTEYYRIGDRSLSRSSALIPVTTRMSISAPPSGM